MLKKLLDEPAVDKPDTEKADTEEADTEKERHGDTGDTKP